MIEILKNWEEDKKKEIIKSEDDVAKKINSQPRRGMAYNLIHPLKKQSIDEYLD